MWVIIKMIKNQLGIKLPVLILNSEHEVWEFETEESAKNMRDIFQENTDSGHEYIIKKI